MQEIKNFSKIELMAFSNPEIRSLRFVNIVAYDNNHIFYYDCLLADLVLLNRNLVMKWKDGNLFEKDFPFSNKPSKLNNRNPSFQKISWDTAKNNAQKINVFLAYLTLEHINDIDLVNDIQSVIKSITDFFELYNNVNKNLVKTNFQIRNMITDNINDNTFSKLKSPTLFKKINFVDRHKNEVYLLLEKIFTNFELISKYKIKDIIIEVRNIDEYLFNHIQNIYFSTFFSSINIENETLSILNKINNYLTEKIDEFLEHCINEQVKLIESIQEKFNKDNI